MRICFKVVFIIHALLLLCIALRHEARTESRQTHPMGFVKSTHPTHPTRGVRVGCVLGARTPHEFLRMIVRLDSSKGHLIRKRKTGPGSPLESKYHIQNHLQEAQH